MTSGTGTRLPCVQTARSMNFPLRPTPRLFRQLLLWASLLMVGSGWVDLRDTLSQIPASASARLPLPRLGTWLAGRLETGGLATGEATQGLFLPLFALASVVFVLLFWLRAHAPGPQADRLVL